MSGAEMSGVAAPLDRKRIAAEASAVLAGTCGTASFTKFGRDSAKWQLVSQLPCRATPDGFDAWVELEPIVKGSDGPVGRLRSFCPRTDRAHLRT